MIVNFSVHKISQDTRKLTQTSTLIKKIILFICIAKKMNNKKKSSVKLYGFMILWF
jgi:hypothetical protein